MAKEKKKKKKDSKKKDEKQDFVKQFKIAFRALEDPKKFYTKTFAPLLFLGVLVMAMPFILPMVLPVPINFNQMTFIIGGIVPIMLGVLYPFISWKSRENDINSKMHFFITHLRVLSISDLALKDIINILGGKKAYGALGEELNRISVLSTQWRMPLSKSFRFISERTPSKIFKDFLDRFSQSLDSGVEHREFVETEQEAVLQEYKTIYESSNENVVILNEVYVAMLIAIIFVMSLGIVLPFVMGTEDMNTFIFLSSFLMIVSEGMLMYLLKAMIPQDDIWHVTGEKGALEERLGKYFKTSIVICMLVGSFFFYAIFSLGIPFFQALPIGVLIPLLTAVSISPLLIIGTMTFM